jgi:hypothetical protein
MISSDPKLNTNEKLQTFYNMALQDDFFIYSNMDFNNPKVLFLF